MTTVKAYAAQSDETGLAPWTLERRELRPDDVSIEILYCGVCHTDVHYAANDWGTTKYPVVPGHEIVGRVTAVGPEVRRYTVGDIVGVGCMVDSCRACSACQRGLEQYCSVSPVFTYNGSDRHDGARTYGGYSKAIVVSEAFVLRIPDRLDPRTAAPILCAGITTYAPLRKFGVGPRHTLAVVGMGGLGHMGIKLAKAMGAKVTLLTRSDAKVEEARRSGADDVIVTSQSGALAEAAERFDFILDTVPVEHDLNPYLKCLGPDGVYILVGQMTPIEPPLEAATLVRRGRMIAGSLIGGLPQTQEVLDFCAEHDVGCDVEMLDIKDLNQAYERMKRGDVRYRFVIDMASLV